MCFIIMHSRWLFSVPLYAIIVAFGAGVAFAAGLILFIVLRR